MLDGAVTASVVEGNLLIQGDESDNRITLDREQLKRDDVRITVDIGSTINGSGDPLVLSGVTGDVRVTLLGSNDRLTIRSLSVRGNLIVDGGEGDNVLLTSRSRIGGNVQIKTAGGFDSVHLVNSAVKGTTEIDTGAAPDIVSLDRSTFRDDARVNTAAGDDTIFVNSRFRGDRLIDPGSGSNHVTEDAVFASFDFRLGRQGWEAGFADYRAGDEDFFELAAGLRPLPPELRDRGTGFFIRGSNHSDDLFMFLKRQLGPSAGLLPNQTYLVQLEIQFASNVPSGCAGIGGSPGESVWLKAGASTIEPQAIPEEDRFLRMNVDKGNQSTAGTAASVVGTIGNAIPCDEALRRGDPKYVSLVRPHVHEFLVRTDDKRQLWLLVGTDSGFEGPTALYFQRIDARLIPVNDRSR
jgi:hypothetical protein